MNYVLVYSVRGHEHTLVRDSLDAVNRAIRALYDEEDEVVVLRIEQDHDGPRTWQIEYPPAPPAGTRVRQHATGPVLEVGEDGRVMIGQTSHSWRGLLEHGPLTEVVETEVEAAARRLREYGLHSGTRTWDAATMRDAATVLAHVLNGGQL